MNSTEFSSTIMEKTNNIFFYLIKTTYVAFLPFIYTNTQVNIVTHTLVSQLLEFLLRELRRIKV